MLHISSPLTLIHGLHGHIARSFLLTMVCFFLMSVDCHGGPVGPLVCPLDCLNTGSYSE